MGDQEVEKKLKAEELIQAENLIEEGKFDRALKLLKIFDKKNSISKHDKLSCYHLRSQLLIWQGKYEEAIKICEEMYIFSQLYDYKLKSIDSLILLSHIYTYQYEDDKALNLVEKAENLLKTISQESPELFLGRKAHLLYCQGSIYFHKGDLTRALEYLERSLSLREEIGYKQEIAESYYTIARVLAYNGNFDRALKPLKRSLKLATESNSLFYIGLCYNTLGTIDIFKGKINRSLANFEKALAIFKKIKNKKVISGLLNNMGETYILKGEMNQALEYLEQSLELDKNFDIGYLKFGTLDTAIQIALEINDINRAQKYFQALEKINDQEDNEVINFVYLYNKALILKASSHKSDRIKAKEILEELVEKKIHFVFEISVKALLNLCEILLSELIATSNLELMDQIQLYINHILKIAKNQNLLLLLVESYLLEAKFDLITLDLKKAQETLTEAKAIAEINSMNHLVKKVSIELKELQNQTNKWLKLKNSNKSIIELANLTPLKEQIRYMLQKREIFKSLNI